MQYVSDDTRKNEINIEKCDKWSFNKMKGDGDKSRISTEGYITPEKAIREGLEKESHAFREYIY